MQKENRLGKLLYPSIYKEGTGEPPSLPAGGVKLFFRLLGGYFFKLVALNLLTVLLSLPLVTVPAGLCALSRVLMKLAMDGDCPVYRVYFREWKAALVRYVPFFVLSAAPAVGGVWLVYSRFSSLAGLGGFALVAVSALVFLYVYLLWCYAFPLFASVDLPVWRNVRNAMYFVATRRRENLFLLLPLVLAALGLLLLPWSAPAFLLLLVSVFALMICCVVKPPIMENVIKPFQTSAEESACNHQQGE